MRMYRHVMTAEYVSRERGLYHPYTCAIIRHNIRNVRLPDMLSCTGVRYHEP